MGKELAKRVRAMAAAGQPAGAHRPKEIIRLGETSAEDGTVRIWATDELADPVVLRHERPARTVQFSPSGEQVLTVDDTVRLWVTHGHDEPLVLPHPGSTMIATFSPGGANGFSPIPVTG